MYLIIVWLNSNISIAKLNKWQKETTKAVYTKLRSYCLLQTACHVNMPANWNNRAVCMQISRDIYVAPYWPNVEIPSVEHSKCKKISAVSYQHGNRLICSRNINYSNTREFMNSLVMSTFPLKKLVKTEHTPFQMSK